MSEQNGAHLNGHTPPLPSAGGQGELLQERGHERTDLRLIGRGLREGWLSPVMLSEKLRKRLPDTLEELICSDKDRVRTAACGLVVQALKYNLALVEAVDNAGRLSDGDATERIEIVYRKPERVIIDE